MKLIFKYKKTQKSSIKYGRMNPVSQEENDIPIWHKNKRMQGWFNISTSIGIIHNINTLKKRSFGDLHGY